MKFKRITAAVLSLVMLLTSVPAPALAAVSDTASQYVSAGKSTVAEQIEALSEGDTEHMIDTLQQLGLLDADGALVLDQKVVLNGHEYSLSEIRELIDSGADLSQLAYVDGVPIALGDLQTMIEIEDQISNIRDTYLSGTEYSTEQQAGLDSLLEYLQNNSLTLEGETQLAPINDHAVVDVYSSPITLNSSNLAADEQNNWVFDYIDKAYPITVTAGKTFSFDFRLLKPDTSNARVVLLEKTGDGKYKYLTHSEDWASSFSYTPTKSGTLYLAAGPMWPINDTETPFVFYGNVCCALSFYNCKGISFKTNGSGAEDTEYTMLLSESHYVGHDIEFFARSGITITEDAGRSWDCTYVDDDPLDRELYYTFLRTRTVDEYSEVYDESTFSWEAEQILTSWYLMGRQAYKSADYWNSKGVADKDRDNTYQQLIGYKLGLKTQGSYKVSCFSSPQDATFKWNGSEYKTGVEYTGSEDIPGSVIYTTTSYQPYFAIHYANEKKPEKTTVTSALISLADSIKENELEITIPTTQKTFSSGEYIPIQMRLNEMVSLNNAKITINNTEYDIVKDLHGQSVGSLILMWYKVKDGDAATKLNITLPVKTDGTIPGFESFIGYHTTFKLVNGHDKVWEFTGFTLNTLQPQSAAASTSLTVSGEEGSTSDKYKITVSAAVSDVWKQKWKSKYTAEAVVINNATGETVVTVPLELNDSLTAVSGSAEVSRQLNDLDCTVRLKLSEKGGSTCIRYAYQKAIRIPKVTLVNGLSIVDNSTVRELSLSDTYRPTLSVSFTGTPTFTSGSWSSSDEDIAVVDDSGVVELVGKKIGEVYFTFTADDGGMTDPDKTAVKSAVSATYTVGIGQYPSLVIPGNSGTVVTRSGNSARVLWSSNARYFSEEPFTFKVEVFEGNLTADELTAAAIYTDELEDTATSARIPAEVLQTISAGMIPSYTVRISMPHPEYSDMVLSAIAHIVVRPQPVTVSLSASPEGLYHVDSESSIVISWQLGEYSAVNTEGSITVTRVTDDDSEVVFSTDTMSETGSYTLNLSKVDAEHLRDTYMVQAQARNTEEDGWSVDSFPLYVYRDNFLALVDENGNELPDAVKLDNTYKVESYTRDAVNNGDSTEDVLRLREELGLFLMAGVNYDDSSWSLKNDSIKWSTSNNSKVSVNYAQGGIYENINLFDYTQYLPSIQMMISSSKDGSATVTATHANTGESDSVQVNVSTLKNKFYLFQFSPAAETTIYYYVGNNYSERKTAKSNADGVLALYEPEGIYANIWASSEVNGEPYLGTFYYKWVRDGDGSKHGNCIAAQSGEADYASGGLYPLNTFELRPAAKVRLNLKQPNGSPYTGKLIVRGGVYKNGGYCDSAELGTSPDPDSMDDGAVGIEFQADKDGFITVYFNPTQFWSDENGETAEDALKLSPDDELQYIFELSRFDGEKYNPTFIDADGSVSEKSLVQTASNIVELEYNTYKGGYWQHNPVLAYQAVTYTGSEPKDVRHWNGYIGPSAAYPEAVLTTQYLVSQMNLQGGRVNYYKVEMVDQNGVAPECQTSTTVKYPFAAYAIVENTLTLTAETMTDSGWLDKGAGRKYAQLSARIYHDNVMIRQASSGLKATDMTGVGDAAVSDKVSKIMSTLSDVSKYLNGSLRENIGELTDNKVVSVLVGLLKTDSLAADFPVKMIITPTESNTRFHAMLVVGVNFTDLDELDYNESGIAWGYDILKGSSDTSLTTDLKASKMALRAYKSSKGKSTSAISGKEKDEVSEMFKQTRSDVNVNVTLNGTYEAEIVYDFVEEEWKIFTVGGGAQAGIGIDYGVTIDGAAGPIPIAANFQLGGAMELSVSTAVRFNEVSEALKWVSGYDNVNDFLISLRVNAYFEAFGGVGFDYSIVAMKTGLFGQISVDAQMDWLLRNYLANDTLRTKNGQTIKLSGEAGIKFEVKLLIFSYECVIASGSTGYSWVLNDEAYIRDYWKNTGSGYDNGGGLLTADSGGDSGFREVSSAATLQSREYLDEYARSYGRVRRMFISRDKLDTLQSNANPASEPQVTSDGAITLFVSDNGSSSIYDSRVLAGSSVSSAKRIDELTGFEGNGDSSPSLYGTDDFAVAAWVRLGSSLPDKDSGAEISGDEQLLLMSSSEIVASVYDGSKWTAARLTENSTPDLAPAVAANNGRAVVAWRSVYTDNNENITDYLDDRILYRCYSDEAGWGEEKVLYNGTSGAVKSLNTAMLSDGTSLVAYTIARNVGGTEVSALAYSMIAPDGTPGSTMLVTDGRSYDENVQLQVISEAADEERFILAWYSSVSNSDEAVNGDQGTVRFLSVDSQGILSNTFPESVDELFSDQNAAIPAGFALTQPGEGASLDRLSIIWAQTVDADGNSISEGNESADHSVIYGAKFCYAADGSVCLSAPTKLTDLSARTLLNDISAYTDAEENIRMTMLNTWYDPDNNDYYDASTGQKYTGSGIPNDGDWIIVPKEQCLIQTASGKLSNAVEVDSIDVDYGTLSLNALTPIRFALRNAGIEEISSIDIKIGDKTTSYMLDEPLLPNQTVNLSYYYSTGSKLTDPNYTVTAHFGSGDKNFSGTVYLCYPDIGISKMEVIDESAGKRTVRMVLYNSSPAELVKGTHQVKLGLYTDSDYENIQAVACDSDGVKVEANNTLTVSGTDALRQINEGVFSLDVVFDVKSFLDERGVNEIPEDGLRLYADSWIINEDNIQYELDDDNNSSNVVLESLLLRSGEALTTSLEQGNDGEITAVTVTLKNNSMRSCSNGALIAVLLDEDGNVLEQQQVTLAGTLDGETALTKDISFGQLGSRVSVTGGVLSADSDQDEAALTALRFEGWPVDISSFKLDEQSGEYRAEINISAGTALMTYQCANANCTVTLNDEPLDGWLGAAELESGEGITTYRVVVSNGSSSVTYVLNTVVPVYDPIGYDEVYYSVIVAPTANGTATVDRSRALSGENITVTTVPAVGYCLSAIYAADSLGNKIPITCVREGSEYTLVMPSRNVTVYAEFVKAENPFLDVSDDDYYFDAVLWALRNGITAGVDSEHFDPLGTATRAQMVSFLWRAAGSPTVGGDRPFADVPDNAYYSEAVRWAVVKGITSGTGDGCFSPHQSVTRAQAVAFLARMNGIDDNASGYTHSFVDVKTDDYFNNAVAWAVSNGITVGTTATTFSPTAACQRCQIVSFLYRTFVR